MSRYRRRMLLEVGEAHGGGSGSQQQRKLEVPGAEVGVVGKAAEVLVVGERERRWLELVAEAAGAGRAGGGSGRSQWAAAVELGGGGRARTDGPNLFMFKLV